MQTKSILTKLNEELFKREDNKYPMRALFRHPRGFFKQYKLHNPKGKTTAENMVGYIDLTDKEFEEYFNSLSPTVKEVYKKRGLFQITISGTIVPAIGFKGLAVVKTSELPKKEQIENQQKEIKFKNWLNERKKF